MVTSLPNSRSSSSWLPSQPHPRPNLFVTPGKTPSVLEPHLVALENRDDFTTLFLGLVGVKIPKWSMSFFAQGRESHEALREGRTFIKGMRKDLRKIGLDTAFSLHSQEQSKWKKKKKTLRGLVENNPSCPQFLAVSQIYGAHPPHGLCPSCPLAWFFIHIKCHLTGGPAFSVLLCHQCPVVFSGALINT